MASLDLFDAVRIIGLPNGRQEQRPHFSETRTKHIQIGDIGTVIGTWPQNRYRIEAVNNAGAILWQDYLASDQLERLTPTAATYSRRRINEHWACQLSLGPELLEEEPRRTALTFARKVMAFAARNVEWLRERLEKSGYRFANEQPFVPPENHVAENLEELAKRGVHLPIALQAWLMEVGCVDLCGTHPDWPRTGYAGLCEAKSSRKDPGAPIRWSSR